MWDHFQQFADNFADGLWGILPSMTEESDVGEMAKNIAATVISLLIAGGVGGGVVAWQQAESNEQAIERIESTQERILSILQKKGETNARIE